MELPDDVVDDLRKRLRRVAGQVQGVERMLAEGRDCRDVVTQLTAVSKAVDRAAFKLVSAGLAYCISDPAKAEAEGYVLPEVEKMFMNLA
ncbi:MAG: metal-sensitive transcriptional regulator [Acidobacteriota bacterium]|nr:metal-sensitive transcriptional regulator [Acidobacteriota bacterium]